MTEEYANRAAQKIMQDFAYKLGDIIDEYPAAVFVFLVCVMRGVSASLEAGFDETDRQLLSVLMERTNCVVMPTALDPRRQAHE